MQKLKLFFSRKDVTILIIALALLSRIMQVIFFYNIGEDGMYQVMAMQNFVHGHGISIGYTLPGDLSTIYYHPLINWPPGYSLILAPLYLLFNHNYIIAGITMDIIFALLLIFTCRRILRLLDVPLFLVNFYTLISGFFIYYFYFIDSSDAIAISFFMISVYYTLLLFRKTEANIKIIAGIAIPLFIAGLIKYLFIPVVFVIPVFIFYQGIVNRNRSFKRAGIVTGLILIILLGAMLFYQKQMSGTIGYVSQPTRGFYPENLVPAFPAIPASFIRPNTVGLIIGKHPVGHGMIYIFLQFIHFIILILITGWSLIKIFKKKLKNLTATNVLFCLGLLLLLAITFELGLLSLLVGKEENVPGNLWTYIEDPRYYGLVNVMIHLGVFAAWIFIVKLPAIRKKWVTALLILLLLPELFKGIYFTIRRISQFNKEAYIWQLEKKYLDFADDIIEKERKINPHINVVVAGSLYYLDNRVSMYSHTAILNEADWISNPLQLHSKKTTVLLFIVEEKKLEEFHAITGDPKTKNVGNLDGFYYYTLHIDPY